MQVERRGPTPRPRVLVNQQREEPVPEAKPYSIPKQLVMDAYQRVRQNRGAAGGGGEALAGLGKGLERRRHTSCERRGLGAYMSPPREHLAMTQDVWRPHARA